jgi:hypothetical protein
MSRIELIQRELIRLDQKKVTFEFVTYLAEHLAEVISASELIENNNINKTQIQIEASAQLCVASTLLKSKTYRPLLDAWFMRRSDQPHAIRDLEYLDMKFKLMKIFNENRILKEENLQLREFIDTNNRTQNLINLQNDGMLIVDALLRHFSNFWRIDEGALIQPSPGNPLIISSDLFTTYLEWKRREIPQK